MYSKSGLNFNKSFWSLYTFLVRFWFSNFAYILCWQTVSCMLLPPEIKCYNLIFQSKSGFCRFSLSILPEVARSFVSLNIHILSDTYILFEIIFCDVLINWIILIVLDPNHWWASYSPHVFTKNEFRVFIQSITSRQLYDYIVIKIVKTRNLFFVKKYLKNL